MLKTALIAGGTLWEAVAGGGDVDEQVILACARTKLAVVAADERDGGRRQVLNLGHTVGHAIETASGYARYRHGEAVGLGLLAALRLSGQDALRERVRELMIARGLPVRIDEGSLDEILSAMGRDKKRTGDSVPFVLVRAPGEVEFGCELPAGGHPRGGRGAAGMSAAGKRIEVMHGVNLDQLGRRDPLFYGTLTLAELEQQIAQDARALGLDTRFFHTNHEGEFIEHLHSLQARPPKRMRSC